MKNHTKSSKKIIFITAVTVITIFIAFITIFNYFLYKNSVAQSNFALMYKVVSAVENLQIPADTNPQTKKTYLTQASLVLPVIPKNFGEVTYWGTLEKTDAGVHIVSNRDLTSTAAKIMYDADNQSFSTDDLLSRIPKLQACGRGVTVVTSNENTGGMGKLHGSKQLKNGQTVHFYMEDACFNKDLVEYALKVDSY